MMIAPAKVQRFVTTRMIRVGGDDDVRAPATYHGRSCNVKIRLVGPIEERAGNIDCGAKRARGNSRLPDLHRRPQ